MFDLAGDEGTAAELRSRQLHWDKKKKKFVKGDGIGADNVKMVKTEGGNKLPATYRSGRWEEWSKKQKVGMPKIGEAEIPRVRNREGNRAFKHTKVVAPKPLDKLSMGYDRKVRQMKKREGDQDGDTPRSSKPSRSGGKPSPSRGRRYAGKSMTRVKTELKTTEQIRKGRKLAEKKRAKNARPSKRQGTTKGKR